MVILTKDLWFPGVNFANSDGLLAIGGDLSVDRLLLAYRSGIFPWFNDGDPICWWSPSQRMVFDLNSNEPIHITKSLKQSKRNRNYEIRENTNFRQVLMACATVYRDGQLGTWITDAMINAYCELHKLGHAHSVEVYLDTILVGGLYGIDLKDKGVFCGESMFSKATDASKIALWFLVEKLQAQDYKLIDAQLYNDHLDALGAVEMPRKDFINILNS